MYVRLRKGNGPKLAQQTFMAERRFKTGLTSSLGINGNKIGSEVVLLTWYKEIPGDFEMMSGKDGV